MSEHNIRVKTNVKDKFDEAFYKAKSKNRKLTQSDFVEFLIDRKPEVQSN